MCTSNITSFSSAYLIGKNRWWIRTVRLEVIQVVTHRIFLIYDSITWMVSDGGKYSFENFFHCTTDVVAYKLIGNVVLRHKGASI